jgi:predicted nucleic acid-binding protein
MRGVDVNVLVYAHRSDTDDHLCATTEARGDHVPEAFLAARAIESNATWMTADRGFARYPGLRWAHPLDT